MTWQAVAVFLACARIGAVHSVVFAGFSSESLRDRVQDCSSRVVITSDEGRRGGKPIATKAIVDAALKECPLVEHVLVLKRTGGQIGWTEGRDKWYHEEIAKVPNYCPPEIMASEDPLFILYVSFFFCLSSSPLKFSLLDVRIYRQTKGCCPHHRRVSSLCSPHCQIRL